MLNKLKEYHVNIFKKLVFSEEFKSSLIKILLKGEAKTRLKIHEILETLAQYFVNYCATRSVYEI